MYEIDDLFRDSVIFEDFLDDGKKRSDSHTQSSDSDSSSSSSEYDYDGSSSSSEESSSSYSGSNYYLYRKVGENKTEEVTAKEEEPVLEPVKEEPTTEVKPMRKLDVFFDKYSWLVAAVIFFLFIELVCLLLDFIISLWRNY